MTITTIDRVLSSSPIVALSSVVAGNEQPQGAVRQDADAEQARHDEEHADDHRIDVEVSGQTAGDPASLRRVARGPAQSTEVEDLVAAHSRAGRRTSCRWGAPEDAAGRMRVPVMGVGPQGRPPIGGCWFFGC